MSAQAVVVGVGMVPFGRHDALAGQLARDAVIEALRDAGVDRDAVDATYVASVYAGSCIGQRIARWTGITKRPIINVENACASGATALHEAWMSIISGRHDLVLVVGVDVLSGASGTLPLPDDDPEARLGQSAPALYAMRAQRYLAEREATPTDLATVVVKNRRHALHNPLAQLRAAVTVDEVLASRPIAEPLTLLQCCPRGDGAAAAVLCSPARAAQLTRTPILIRAMHIGAGWWTPGYRDLTRPESTMRVAAEAYEIAGIGPDDVDVAEVHDAFSISELLYYEALGLCGAQSATAFLRDGGSALGGRLPVNPSGGLLAKGHPPGATGLAQLHEAVHQLRGGVGARQVADARVALVHCTGGGVSGYDHAVASVGIVTR